MTPLPGAPAACARDLHDSVAQTLFAAHLLAGTLARDAALPDVARDRARTLERLQQGALAELRLLLVELRPDLLAATTLAELLRHVAAAAQARGTLDIVTKLAPADPPPAQRLALVRVVHQALVALARDGQPRRVRLTWLAPRPGAGRLALAYEGARLGGVDGLAGCVAPVLHKTAATAGRLQVERTPMPGDGVAIDIHWN